MELITFCFVMPSDLGTWGVWNVDKARVERDVAEIALALQSRYQLIWVDSKLPLDDWAGNPLYQASLLGLQEPYVCSVMGVHKANPGNWWGYSNWGFHQEGIVTDYAMLPLILDLPAWQAPWNRRTMLGVWAHEAEHELCRCDHDKMPGRFLFWWMLFTT